MEQNRWEHIPSSEQMKESTAKHSWTRIICDDACKNSVANIWDILEETLLIKKVIIDRLNRDLLELRKTGNMSSFDMWEDVELYFDEWFEKEILPYKWNDIVIWERRIDTIMINWVEESMYFFPISVKWINFSLISIPNWLKLMKLKETFIWKQFLRFSDKHIVPHFSLETTIWEIAPHFLILWTDFLKDNNWKTIVNTQIHWRDNSLLKHIGVKWFVSNPLTESIILSELVMNKLWIDYVNFIWRDCDSDNEWSEIARDKIKIICKFLWINNIELIQYKNWYWIEKSVAVNWVGIYKSISWNMEWVILWDRHDWLMWDHPNHWAIGSLFTLGLWYWHWISSDINWIRPSLGYF